MSTTNKRQNSITGLLAQEPASYKINLIGDGEKYSVVLVQNLVNILPIGWRDIDEIIDDDINDSAIGVAGIVQSVSIFVDVVLARFVFPCIVAVM